LPLLLFSSSLLISSQSSINEGFNDHYSKSGGGGGGGGVMIGGRPASMNASSLSSLSESLSCDVHPTTGNILYCLKELSPGYSLVYRKMHDLALSYGILSRSMITIPNEVDDIVLSLLENLLLALETRAAQFDEQLKNNKSGGGGGSHPGSNKSGQAASTPGKREMNTKAHSLFEMEDKHAEESVLSARKHLFLANNFHSIFNYLKERTHRINNNSNPSPNEEKDKNPSTPSNPNRRGTNPANNPIRQQKFLSYNERIEQK
jgi:hypothetical protein